MLSKTILTVEDDQALRKAIVTKLTNEGFKVIAAGSGAEGVRLALKEHPDLILMDIGLPEMNGHEAMKEIRKDPWGKDAKVIFLSALDDATNVFKAVESQSKEYLIKPHTSLKKLVSEVNLALVSDYQ